MKNYSTFIYCLLIAIAICNGYEYPKPEETFDKEGKFKLNF
jgi:hypothetical protein